MKSKYSEKIANYLPKSTISGKNNVFIHIIEPLMSKPLVKFYDHIINYDYNF